MPRGAVIWCALFVVPAVVPAAIACDAPVGHPPIARITLAPAAIPAHDNFQTVVTLDGSASADPIDDPAGTEKLTYAWTITDAQNRFAAGSTETSQKPMVTFAGERAATITLTVTDIDGNDDTATKYLELSVPNP
jgi:hypothetical protein